MMSNKIFFRYTVYSWTREKKSAFQINHSYVLWFRFIFDFLFMLWFIISTYSIYIVIIGLAVESFVRYTGCEFYFSFYWNSIKYTYYYIRALLVRSRTITKNPEKTYFFLFSNFNIPPSDDWKIFGILLNFSSEVNS